MRFQLTPMFMTLGDLDLLSVRILSEFRGISQIWEPTTAKGTKIDPYCQRRNSSLTFSTVYRLRWYRRAFFHCVASILRQTSVGWEN